MKGILFLLGISLVFVGIAVCSGKSNWVGIAADLLEVLAGGAHSNFYGYACSQEGICGSKSPSNNAFALAIGGGVDIKATERIAIRLVDADYELTRFGNNFTGGNNSQSNFRFQTGRQFRF